MTTPPENPPLQIHPISSQSLSKSKYITVNSFKNLPPSLQDIIVSPKTKITQEKAQKNLYLILLLLHHKTHLIFYLRTSAKVIKAPKKPSRILPSLIDSELTSYRDLSSESDTLVSTDIPKKNYTHLKSVTRRVEIFTSARDPFSIAVKCLPHTSNQKQQRNNYQEIRLLKFAKGHNHIVSYIRCMMFKEELWISMECLGITLKQANSVYLNRWKESQLRYIATHILLGLEYLHRFKIVHRGISSDHIMNSIIRGNLKIISMSHCADVSREPVKGLVGSPFYAAPEIIMLEPYGISVDLWSLGVLLLELTNGEVPHKRSSIRAMFCTVIEGHQRYLKSEKISKEFADFLNYCLSKQPEKRGTAKSLLEHEWITDKNVAKRREMMDIFSFLKQQLESPSEVYPIVTTRNT